MWFLNKGLLSFTALTHNAQKTFMYPSYIDWYEPVDASKLEETIGSNREFSSILNYDLFPDTLPHLHLLSELPIALRSRDNIAIIFSFWMARAIQPSTKRFNRLDDFLSIGLLVLCDQIA